MASSLAVLNQVASTPGPTPVSQPQASSLDVLKQVQANPDQAANNNAEQLQPYDKAKFGRFTTEENYPTWAKTQPKVGPDLKPGEYEAWTGAHLSPSDSLKASGEAVAGGAVAFGGAMGAVYSPALYELAVKHLAGNVLPEMEGEAAKAKLIEYAPKVLKAAHDLGISAVGLSLLWKAVFGGRGK